MNEVSNPPIETPSSIDLLNVLFEHKISVLIIFSATILMVALMVYVVLSPKYESKATLLVNFTDITRPIVNAPPKSDFEKVTDFHTQKDILLSSSLARKTADDINLSETRFIGNIEKIKIAVHHVKQFIGELLCIEKWTKSWDPEAAAVDWVMRAIEVKTSPESKAIKISYRAFNAEEAKKTLNALVANYQGFYYEQIRKEAKGILNYLESQLELSKHDLTKTEIKLKKFKERDMLSYRRNKISSRKYSMIGITDSATVQDELKIYILQMEEDLRHLQQKFAKTDPKIIELEKKLSFFIKAVNLLPERELELCRLKRKMDLNEDKYLIMARNLEQARVIAMGQASKMGLVTVIDSPKAKEKPVSPKRRLLLILSIFMGAMLALAWVYLMNFLDHTVRSPATIQKHLRIRYLGSLPQIKQKGIT